MIGLTLFLWIVGRIGQALSNGRNSPAWLCKLCLVSPKLQKLDPLSTLIQLQAYEFIPLIWITHNWVDPQWRNTFVGFTMLVLILVNYFLLEQIISKN